MAPQRATMWPFQIEWASGSLNAAPKVGAADGSQSPSRFDLASLTKVIVTSSCLVDLFLQSGQEWSAFVDQPVSQLITEFRSGPLAKTSLREFWEHRSGLPAHVLLFDPPRAQGLLRAEAYRIALAKIAQQPVTPNAGPVYSDLGYLVVGAFLERLAGTDLLSLWQRWRSRHLPAQNGLRYFAELSAAERAQVQPTEIDRHARGEINDDNGFGFGEASAHAGITGTVKDVWQWMQALQTWQAADARIKPWLHQTRLEGQRFVFGWDTPTPAQPHAPSQAGTDAPALTRGHLGYTGTALWWDPESLRGGVLLTNRVTPRHSQQSQDLIRTLRTEFFSALWQNEDLGQGRWLETLKTHKTKSI